MSWVAVGVTATSAVVGSQQAKRAQKAAENAANQVQFTPYNVESGLGAFNLGDDGGINISMSPELQAMSDQFGGQTGMFGQQLSAFDPFSFAQDRMGAFQSLVQPQRQRARDALESRLLAQGRLGSTGGSRQQSEVEEGFARQDTAAAEQALGLGFNRQAQLQQLQQGAFGGMLQAQMAPLSLADLGITAGGGAATAAAQRANMMASAGQIMPNFYSNLASGAMQGAFSGAFSGPSGGGGYPDMTGTAYHQGVPVSYPFQP